MTPPKLLKFVKFQLISITESFIGGQLTFLGHFGIKKGRFLKAKMGLPIGKPAQRPYIGPGVTQNASPGPIVA